ncbi:hypothetical protein BCR34DRAFT_598342 [Clohesyomyces aquaticus]|uniref:Uncharacterized protein n=1 Tax=Clohesyomyces aquaticus TaxID=1231657 RepID=A0A1Y1ZZD2_9PLEO|nr:hypothetical protein BCR34DRAFT_598342 [Clohesyomyces aquaticus]
MEQKFKDLFRRYNQRERRSNNEAEGSIRSGHKQSSSNISSTERYRSPRNSGECSGDYLTTSSVPNHAGGEQNSPKDSIADDYLAYQPVLQDDHLSKDLQYMTLGGDTRSTADASPQKHSEDIADRNIGLWGSGSTVQSRNASIGTVGSTLPRQGSHEKSLAGSLEDDRELCMIPSRKGVDSSPGGNRRSWPARVPRDEYQVDRKKTRQQRHSFSQDIKNELNSGPPGSTVRAETDGSADVESKATRKHDSGMHPGLSNVVDLNDSVDVDKVTEWAPAVTHEVVKPTVHRIREEHIYREIHNHEVYHRIQPVFETEVLPARHFIPNPQGSGLIEVPESHLSNCTGQNQRWSIGERRLATDATQSFPSKLTSPKILGQEQYRTPEGFQRTETTIAHPPTLEDMSGYDGPVLPMHFDEHGRFQEPSRSEEGREFAADDHPPTVKRKELPIHAQQRFPTDLLPPREASLRHGVGMAPVTESV